MLLHLDLLCDPSPTTSASTPTTIFSTLLYIVSHEGRLSCSITLSNYLLCFEAKFNQITLQKPSVFCTASEYLPGPKERKRPYVWFVAATTTTMSYYWIPTLWLVSRECLHLAVNHVLDQATTRFYHNIVASRSLSIATLLTLDLSIRPTRTLLLYAL